MKFEGNKQFFKGTVISGTNITLFIRDPTLSPETFSVRFDDEELHTFEHNDFFKNHHARITKVLEGQTHPSTKLANNMLSVVLSDTIPEFSSIRVYLGEDMLFQSTLQGDINYLLNSEPGSADRTNRMRSIVDRIKPHYERLEADPHADQNVLQWLGEIVQFEKNIRSMSVNPVDEVSKDFSAPPKFCQLTKKVDAKVDANSFLRRREPPVRCYSPERKTPVRIAALPEPKRCIFKVWLADLRKRRAQVPPPPPPPSPPLCRHLTGPSPPRPASTQDRMVPSTLPAPMHLTEAQLITLFTKETKEKVPLLSRDPVHQVDAFRFQGSPGTFWFSASNWFIILSSIVSAAGRAATAEASAKNEDSEGNISDDDLNPVNKRGRCTPLQVPSWQAV